MRTVTIVLFSIVMIGCGSDSESTSAATDASASSDPTNPTPDGVESDDVASVDETTTLDTGEPDTGTVEDVTPDPDTSGCSNTCPFSGSTACDGDAVLTCIVKDGCFAWDAPALCDDEDPCTANSCASGACGFEPVVGCVSKCTQDAVQCKPNSIDILQTCADGIDWTESNCEFICENGACKTTQCVPGTLACNGDSLEKCSGDGADTATLEECALGCVTTDDSAACALCQANTSSCVSATQVSICEDPLQTAVVSDCSSIETCALSACTGTISWTDSDTLEDTYWWITVHIGECWAMANTEPKATGQSGLCWVMDTTWLPEDIDTSDIRDWACAGIADGELDDDFLLGASAGVIAALNCDDPSGNFSIGGGGTLTTGTPLGDWCMVAGPNDDQVAIQSCTSLGGWE
jgi:hypothetical protein